jgi:hypothetical protein
VAVPPFFYFWILVTKTHLYETNKNLNTHGCIYGYGSGRSVGLRWALGKASPVLISDHIFYTIYRLGKANQVWDWDMGRIEDLRRTYLLGVYYAIYGL